MAALLSIPVAVVVDRIKADSQWIDYLWQPSAVLVGAPEAQPWTPLSGDGDRTSFYAGSASIELYRSDTGNYRDNLMGDCKLWVVLTPAESDPPYTLFMVTADPTEGEAQTETGVNLVEAVAMVAPQARSQGRARSTGARSCRRTGAAAGRVAATTRGCPSAERNVA
jgi:hypothetical protein